MTPQQLALRARIILLAADGLSVNESAERLGVWRKTVSEWRKRLRQKHLDIAMSVARSTVLLHDADSGDAGPLTVALDRLAKHYGLVV